MIHVLDASRAVGVASALVSDGPQRERADRTAPPTIITRSAKAARGGRSNELATLAEARANGFAYDHRA